jgi:hypothetical protein
MNKLKMKSIHFILIIILLFFLTIQGFAQSKVELSGGAGFPELINAKISYGENFKIAFSQSILPFYKVPLPFGPTSFETCFHFAGKSKYINQHQWYLLAGLALFWPNKGGFTDQNEVTFGAYPRIGRTINLSKTSGFNFDAGVFIPFFQSRDWPAVSPSLSISLFWRL